MSLRLRSFVIIFLVLEITFSIISPYKLVRADEAGTSVTVAFITQETASDTVDQTEGGEVELVTETGATASASFPSGAVTTSTDVSISSVNETNIALMAPIPSDLNVIGDLVYDFKAEADGQTITTFDQPVTLTFAYTDAQISGLDESSVRVYYWDTTQEDWIIFSDYTLDTTNNVITINTSHFTLFAIMASSPPSLSPGGGGGYYCSNSPPQIISEAIKIATADTEYAYQVEATDSNQDTLVYSLNQKPEGMEINVISGVITWIPTSEQIGKHNVQVIVDDRGCGTHTDTQSFTIIVNEKEIPIAEMTIAEIKVKITEISKAIAILKTQLKQALTEEAAKIIPSGYVFTKNLFYGQKNDDVKYLQAFLKTQGIEIYPEGLVTGYFGPLTKAAAIRLQEKYADEVLAPWDLTEGTGFVGKTTRAKINEILGK